MSNVIAQIKANRLVSTPFVFLTSSDQNAIVVALVEAMLEVDRLDEQRMKAKDKPWSPTPIVTWDRSAGFVGRNNTGRAVIESMNIPPISAVQPSDAMRHAAKMPPKTMLAAFNFDLVLGETTMVQTVQGVCNLRDKYKEDQRMFIMMGSDFNAPPALRNDVLLLEDPLPDNKGYGEIIQTVVNTMRITKPKADGGVFEALPPDVVSEVTLSMKGLSAFVAEQTLSMARAMAPKGPHFHMPSVWELKTRSINAVPGLTMTLDGPDLADLRGLDAITQTFNDYASGPEPPDLYVLVDEIDKGFAGLGTKGGPGDNTGTSQYLHQQFLTYMERHRWTGAILVGIRGSGKTAFTESLGKAHRKPTIRFDLGATKDSKLGESEARSRACFRAIENMGGERVCILATCNRMEVLPPELLRRFTFQQWYFDLPSEAERDALWGVYLPKYGHKPNVKRPNDIGWTGAEIRNCCDLARKLGKSVHEIGSRLIVPIMQSDPDSVTDLRKLAHGRFLSASYEGRYHYEQAPIPTQTKRKVDISLLDS